VWPKRLAKIMTDSLDGDVDVAATRESIAAHFKSA
jgi:hypothetical protein